MSLATPNELARFLGRELDATDREQAQIALDIASAAVRNYTRQQLTRVNDDTVVLRGTPGQALVLPERPVVSVASVSMNGVAVGTSSYQLVRDALWWGARALNTSNDVSGDAGWGTTATPITVVYTHGYARVPDDLRGVCLQLAARTLSAPVGVASESVGSYSVSYDQASLGEFERRLLDRYRRTWR